MILFSIFFSSPPRPLKPFFAAYNRQLQLDIFTEADTQQQGSNIKTFQDQVRVGFKKERIISLYLRRSTSTVI